MRWTTGIEVGPNACTVVAARRGRAVTDVAAVHVLEVPAGYAFDEALTSTLNAARRASRLPRPAAVIVWGLSDDASPNDPTTRAAVRPIVVAGFKVRVVLTPPRALAALAASRPDPDPGSAVAWMALNTHGVALAIVREGEILFSRTFDWAYRPGMESSREQLLQRYALVSHLAPEVQQGIAAVRATGVNVDRAVTCGNLPELRSLTMPLIEELDLEVETLDSAEDLRQVGRGGIEGFAASAPVIRLALAAALARPSGAATHLGPVLLRATAALVLVATLSWLASAAYFAVRERQATPEPVATGPDAPPRGVPKEPSADQGRPAPAMPAPSARSEAVPETPTVVVPPPPVPPPPVPVTPQQAQPTRKPQVEPLQKVPELPRVDVPRTPPVKGGPPPLKEPLPRVESILIAHNRRLAIVDGRIVGVGETVGPRVIVRIDDDGVVFREPSGREVRVALWDGRQNAGS
jgi:hypothetical protein